MNDEPIWLTYEKVVQINLDLVADTGETHFVRDEHILRSALDRPYQQFAYGSEDRIPELTAHTIRAVAQAHAFEQGNKRAAWVAGKVFALANGYLLEVPKDRQMQYALLVEQMSAPEGDKQQIFEDILDLIYEDIREL